jgi:hypothetical protein
VPLAPNTGKCPPDCEIVDEHGEVTGHRRVRVVLENGTDSARSSPHGWASGGRGACDWRLRNHPFAIAQWELI